MREWFWLGMAANLVMLAFSLHMALDAIAFFNTGAASDVATGAVGLFLVLPVFCVVAPMAAWRSFGKGKEGHALATLAAPLLFGAYLMVFLRPIML